MTQPQSHCEPGEQEMITMLAHLPVPIVITAPGPAGGPYRWWCLGHQGTATSLSRALEQALHYLIGRLAG